MSIKIGFIIWVGEKWCSMNRECSMSDKCAGKTVASFIQYWYRVVCRCSDLRGSVIVTDTRWEVSTPGWWLMTGDGLRGTGEIGPEAGARWPLTRNTRNRRGGEWIAESSGVSCLQWQREHQQLSHSSVFSRKWKIRIKRLKHYRQPMQCNNESQ